MNQYELPSALQSVEDATKAMWEAAIPRQVVRLPTPLELESALASDFHVRLIDWINDFNSRLDDEHEVGICLVNFGQTVLFHLSGIGYRNPALISFAGVTEDGEPVELIQHTSQISILLTKMPRLNPDEPKRQFGFDTDS